VGERLAVGTDLSQTLELILTEARHLTGAEAGTLYVVRDGQLQFAVAQNDRLSLAALRAALSARSVPASGGSLAGFVAATGRVVDLPDAYAPPAGAPFRLDRAFDAATGYRTRSVLAVPLGRPEGPCVGVLELLNRRDAAGGIEPFEPDSPAVRSLASMAAVAVHNALLKDQLRAAQLETIIRLSAAAEYIDDDTGGHIRRISAVSARIAKALALPADHVELVRQASPMHDVGKIGIPPAILRKPGPLTPAEREVMQTHTTIGADILGAGSNELLATARQVALRHHERWDGAGYPDGLAEEAIPLEARIVAVADVFDALVSKRCYKNALPRAEALRIVRADAGKHFDPAAVAAFFQAQEAITAEYDAPGGSTNRTDGAPTIREPAVG
jgi:HD-GYP domain-containing protein (c-di-GMP phosphodiesterase class II)